MEPATTDMLLIGAALILVAVLSGAEAAIISVNKVKLRHLIDKGSRSAEAVKRMLDDHARLFSALILSGNLFTVLATSLGTALAIEQWGEDTGIVVATVALTYLTVVFGELAPKTYGVTHAERVSLFLARPLEVYIRLIAPAVWIFSLSSRLTLRLFGLKDKHVSPFVTEEEIKTMITMGEEDGAIEEEEKQLLHRVFEFGDTRVSEAMVPRTEMVAIAAEATVKDALALMSMSSYSRYPVIRDTVDNVVGILYIKDIIRAMSTAEVDGLSVVDFMREPYFVPETKMVTELLDEMRKKNFHIAVVMDEYGGTAGIVTLEDIVEEIVGGLQDEFEAIEAERDVEVIDEHTFIVAGQTPVDEVETLVGVDLNRADFHTIGGYVFGLFGRLPKVGEQIRAHELKFLIMEMDERRIGKIKITKL